MKLVLLAALVAAIAVPVAQAGSSKLVATDGPGFTITLTQGGKKVTRLKPGTYTITVADKSSIHNFHLTGPGVNKKTAVGFKGTKTWKLTLKKGTYKYVCDPHKSFMKGSFKVA
jgi:Copper binding proteins, plastocyanin/azurin family